MRKLLNNKKGIRLDYAILGLIFFTFFILMFSGMFKSNMATYNVDYDNDTIGGIFNLTDDLSSITQDSKENVFGGEVDAADAENSFVKGTVSTLKLMVNLPKLFSSLIVALTVSTGIPVPAFVRTLLTMAFWVAAIFAVGYLAFRISRP